MAPRKKPHTDPVIDSHESAESGNSCALHRDGFLATVRFIKLATMDRVQILEKIALQKLNELEVLPDADAALGGTPPGSDQCDTGTLYNWIKQVPAGDSAAIRQVVHIQATALARINS